MKLNLGVSPPNLHSTNPGVHTAVSSTNVVIAMVMFLVSNNDTPFRPNCNADVDPTPLLHAKHRTQLQLFN